MRIRERGDLQQDTEHEIAYGHNPAIRGYARSDLPTLKEHRALSWHAKALVAG